jgi:hypothetical protein
VSFLVRNYTIHFLPLANSEDANANILKRMVFDIIQSCICLSRHHKKMLDNVWVSSLCSLDYSTRQHRRLTVYGYLRKHSSRPGPEDVKYLELVKILQPSPCYLLRGCGVDIAAKLGLPMLAVVKLPYLKSLQRITCL